ncbi:MAG: hypothetical protein R3258_08660 [Acidimicrobiia bacterium]|nr:hypothetical protein [Acidimicrobiia bacterium]
MSSYEATLYIEGEKEAPIRVTVDLTDDQIVMLVGTDELAAWPRSGLRINALPDGFHIRAEGEVVVVNVDHDAEFALELGLRNAHPALRRRMAALMRNDRAL